MSGTLCVGFMAEPFSDGQVDRFLQQMESKVDQMKQAAEEEKVSSTSAIYCFFAKGLVNVYWYKVSRGIL